MPKKHVSIPQPAFVQQRLLSVSKNARGKKPKVVMGQAVPFLPRRDPMVKPDRGPNVAIHAVPTPDGPKLAVPSDAKPRVQQVIAGKLNFQFPNGQIRRQIGEGHSQAERDAKRSASKSRTAFVKALQADFDAWLATMTPEERREVRKLNLHKPMPENGFVRGKTDEDALHRAEVEIIPEGNIRGSLNGRPIIAMENAAVENMEPQDDLAAEIAGLSPEQVRGATEDFEHGLRWALDGGDLVAIGRRTLVLAATMRPDLVRAVTANPSESKAFLYSFGEPDLRVTIARLLETGAVYGRWLAWARSGSDLAAIGERLQIVAYTLRPDLIDGATQQEIGSPTNKTRQALNKVACDMRDTFNGIVAMVMRPEGTRLRCQQAQLAT